MKAFSLQNRQQSLPNPTGRFWKRISQEVVQEWTDRAGRLCFDFQTALDGKKTAQDLRVKSEIKKRVVSTKTQGCGCVETTWRSNVETKLGKLLSIGNKKWMSGGGLVYEKGSRQGNRVLHILDHLKPNSRKKIHTIFNVGRKNLLALIDEAWLKRREGIPRVRGNAEIYEIPMRKIVGTNREEFIRLVVEKETCRILSAYPVQSTGW